MGASRQEARFVIDRLGRIDDVNDEACTLLGYSRAELFRLYGSELVPAEDRVRVGLSLEQMRRGEADRRHGRLLRKDGSVVPVEVSVEPLPEKRGAPRARWRPRARRSADPSPAATALQSLLVERTGRSLAALTQPALRSEVPLARHVVHFDADALGILEQYRVVPGRESVVLGGCTIVAPSSSAAKRWTASTSSRRRAREQRWCRPARR